MTFTSIRVFPGPKANSSERDRERVLVFVSYAAKPESSISALHVLYHSDDYTGAGSEPVPPRPFQFILLVLSLEETYHVSVSFSLLLNQKEEGVESPISYLCLLSSSVFSASVCAAWHLLRRSMQGVRVRKPRIYHVDLSLLGFITSRCS